MQSQECIVPAIEMHALLFKCIVSLQFKCIVSLQFKCIVSLQCGLVVQMPLFSLTQTVSRHYKHAKTLSCNCFSTATNQRL